jgi:1-phosphofructokinase family hexose kinase
MILCVTPNPALDRTLLVPELHLHGVSRATHVLTAAGGKGLNAARAIRTLGGSVRCAGMLGGHTGRLFAQLAEHEGLDGKWTQIEAETRCATIVANGSWDDVGDASVINEPGPHVTGEEWQQFAQSVIHLSRSAQAITFSGSLPPGPTPEQFAALLTMCAEGGADVWADSSGEWLRAAAVPDISIKVNGEEVAALIGRVITDAQDAARTAVHLRTEYRLRRAIITLGKSGAACAGISGGWVAHAPEISMKSSVGSGDCFLGALVLALCGDANGTNALRSAAAAGAANAMSVGGGQFSLSDYHDALAQIHVEQYAIP